MQDTIPRVLIEAQVARARRCPLRETPPDIPSLAKPSTDHLARCLDAYTAGRLIREYLATVLGELIVITHASMIRGGAR